MANIYLSWFKTLDNKLVGLDRYEHVLVRGWGGEGLPALVRAECFSGCGAAEAEFQRQRRLLREATFVRAPYPTTSMANLLAAEIAARPHDPQPWRDYADWAWRHADPRGTLVELHEAAEQARAPEHAGRIEREIEAHERAHFGQWRSKLIAEHRSGPDAGELQFRRGHLYAVSGMPKFTLDDKAPVALAELSIDLRCPSQLGELAAALERPQWRSLQRFELRLACTLNEAHSAALFDLVFRTMPRLTCLEVLSAPGATTVGPKMLAALGTLLVRQRDVVCGAALERLTLDVHDPVGGWTLSRVSDLIDALAPSDLRELELRAPTIPDDLRAWAEHSGYARRLARCVLRRRIGAHLRETPDTFAMDAAPPAPPRPIEPQSPELAVWADWLQARGHALGELALLWSLEPNGQRRELVGRARAKIECELACVPGVLEVAWSGPLIERVRLSERPLAAQHDAAATLERVLDSPACVRLDELELADIEPTTIARLLRIAQSPRGDSPTVLHNLVALTVSSWCRLDVELLLDALPKLQRLTCRSPNIRMEHVRQHASLRALTLKVASDLNHRGRVRLFSACNVETLPALEHLTLELDDRWRGRPLPFDRIKLAAGAHLTICGLLRWDDVDGLLRWAAEKQLAALEIADRQPWEVERIFRGRVDRLGSTHLLGTIAELRRAA